MINPQRFEFELDELVVHTDGWLAITASRGVASNGEHVYGLEPLYRRSDETLYYVPDAFMPYVEAIKCGLIEAQAAA